VALWKRLALPWFVKALCLAAVVLIVPQVAWASSYGAGSLVGVSGRARSPVRTAVSRARGGKTS